MHWYVGADHAGWELKDEVARRLRELGDEVVDLGTNAGDSVDYPDFAEKVARAVTGDPGSFGVLVCGTGIGISIAANKIDGVRAAVVSGEFTARATRAHNDANILCLGSRVTGAGVALSSVEAFRATDYEGGRHQRRVDKIAELQRGG